MKSFFSNIIIYAMYLMILLLVFLSVLVLLDGFRNSGKTNLQSTSDSGGTTEIKKIEPLKTAIIDNVPFTPQAPFGNWKNIIYEEGCEEASILMAVYWERGLSLSPETANTEIQKISDYEAKTLGNFLNTSVYDTAKVMKGYFGFSQYRIKENITKSDIISTIRNGNLVLAPAFGRDLHNIYYTPPGPVAHMLVIIGYDPIKREFITNDSGTKSGKGYRYDEDILYDAIWAYPTSLGTLLPPDKDAIRDKTVIVVQKK